MLGGEIKNPETETGEGEGGEEEEGKERRTGGEWGNDAGEERSARDRSGSGENPEDECYGDLVFG